jgi:hypothetical protein
MAKRVNEVKEAPLKEHCIGSKNDRLQTNPLYK